MLLWNGTKTQRTFSYAALQTGHAHQELRRAQQIFCKFHNLSSRRVSSFRQHPLVKMAATCAIRSAATRCALARARLGELDLQIILLESLI